MSSKKRHEYVSSREIVNRLKALSKKTQKDIAKEIFNISDTNLYNRIREDRLDFYKLFVWAAHNNVDLNWLILGEGQDPDQQPIPIRPVDDDERAWWRGLTDELREECRRLKKRLEFYEDPTRKSRIRRDDDPAERDEILKKRAM